MCVPGLAAYLRAAGTHLSDIELTDIELTDTDLTDTAPTSTAPAGTGASEGPRPVLVSASGTTATEGRA